METGSEADPAGNLRATLISGVLQMKFELKRNELSVLYGQLKTLRGVPLRQQRREIMAAAEAALPKGAANQLFLAIGSGGEMSQVGGAQSVLDQCMPFATYTVQSANQ